MVSMIMSEQHWPNVLLYISDPPMSTKLLTVSLYSLKLWITSSHPQLLTTINEWLIIDLRYILYTLYLVLLAFLDLSVIVLAGTPPSSWKSIQRPNQSSLGVPNSFRAYQSPDSGNLSPNNTNKYFFMKSF